MDKKLLIFVIIGILFAVLGGCLTTSSLLGRTFSDSADCLAYVREQGRSSECGCTEREAYKLNPAYWKMDCSGNAQIKSVEINSPCTSDSQCEFCCEARYCRAEKFCPSFVSQIESYIDSGQTYVEPDGNIVHEGISEVGQLDESKLSINSPCTSDSQCEFCCEARYCRAEKFCSSWFEDLFSFQEDIIDAGQTYIEPDGNIVHEGISEFGQFDESNYYCYSDEKFCFKSDSPCVLATNPIDFGGDIKILTSLFNVVHNVATGTSFGHSSMSDCYSEHWMDFVFSWRMFSFVLIGSLILIVLSVLFKLHILNKVSLSILFLYIVIFIFKVVSK